VVAEKHPVQLLVIVLSLPLNKILYQPVQLL
jgi:hypothetical protein